MWARGQRFCARAASKEPVPGDRAFFANRFFFLAAELGRVSRTGENPAGAATVVVLATADVVVVVAVTVLVIVRVGRLDVLVEVDVTVDVKVS